MKSKENTKPIITFGRQLELQFDDDLNAMDEYEASKPEPLHEARKRLHYISFASGSSGNSCYVGNDKGGIIIDAGIRADQIEDILAEHGVNMR